MEVLERGDIQFFYRPIVQSADPYTEHPAGVQSFFVVLSTRVTHRRVRIGRKRMPETTGERLWARVERVGSFERAMGDLLEDEHYHTKTRGDRFQPGARAIARGSYAFVRHGDHIHFVYRVESREPDAEVDVPDAASHVVLFERVLPGRATWTTDGVPARLDEEGAEIVLVGVREEPERALGVELLT
jgi:hypothetical protein